MRYFVLIIITLLPFSPVWSQSPNVGSNAPAWSLQTGDGNTIDYYEDSENSVSVVLFWSTRCSYCASLMPHLEVIYRKYRNKGLKFYAIDILEDGKLDPLEYFKMKGYTYTLLLDGDHVAEDYGVKATPGLYVVDKDKKITYRRPAGVSDVLVKQNVDLRIKQAIAR